MSQNGFSSDFVSSKPVTARAVGGIFGGLLVLLSALTTAAFFFKYAPTAFDFLVGDLSPWLSALVGVLVFEVASLVWSWLKANDADTGAQLAVSNLSAWAAMACGLAVTVVYFSLGTDLINAQLDATAETAVSLVGGVLIVIGIGGNFCAGFVYRISGAMHSSATQQSQLRAMQTGAAFAANREATYAELQRTLEGIRAQLPDVANQQGAANSEQFINERFRIGDNRPTGRQNGR